MASPLNHSCHKIFPILSPLYCLGSFGKWHVSSIIRTEIAYLQKTVNLYCYVYSTDCLTNYTKSQVG
jgi:hypothetical protein